MYENIILEFLFSGFLYTILAILFSYMFPKVFATNRDEIRENLNKIVKKIL